MQENVYENLRNPARARRAGAMRQFPSGQLDSSDSDTYVLEYSLVRGLRRVFMPFLVDPDETLH